VSTGRAKDRGAAVEALVNAGREYSTAAVMLHGAIASRFGLAATDLKALDILQRLGPVTAGEIAIQTGLATASVTSLVDRLERKRLVRRLQDRQDRRRVLVGLTGKLDESIAPLFASLGRRVRARCRAYDEDRIALLRDFLSGCAEDMRDETAKLTGRARRGRRR